MKKTITSRAAHQKPLTYNRVLSLATYGPRKPTSDPLGARKKTKTANNERQIPRLAPDVAHVEGEGRQELRLRPVGLDGRRRLLGASPESKATLLGS